MAGTGYSIVIPYRIRKPSALFRLSSRGCKYRDPDTSSWTYDAGAYRNTILTRQSAGHFWSRFRGQGHDGEFSRYACRIRSYQTSSYVERPAQAQFTCQKHYPGLGWPAREAASRRHSKRTLIGGSSQAGCFDPTAQA